MRFRSNSDIRIAHTRSHLVPIYFSSAETLYRIDMASSVPISDEDLDLALGAVTVACIVAEIEKPKRKKRKWVKDWLMKRNELSHECLLNELKLEPGDWFNYVRMDEKTYMELLFMVSPFIEKKDTYMRKAISPHEKLLATLRFLATGRSYEDMKFSTLISAQSLGHIIPETCRAIIQALQQEFMKVRNTFL